MPKTHIYVHALYAACACVCLRKKEKNIKKVKTCCTWALKNALVIIWPPSPVHLLPLIHKCPALSAVSTCPVCNLKICCFPLYAFSSFLYTFSFAVAHGSFVTSADYSFIHSFSLSHMCTNVYVCMCEFVTVTFKMVCHFSFPRFCIMCILFYFLNLRVVGNFHQTFKADQRTFHGCGKCVWVGVFCESFNRPVFWWIEKIKHL